MNTPTHDEIAKLADQLWRNQGSPSGRDTEIWLEAERKLNKNPVPDSEVETHLSVQPEEKFIKAAAKKEAARADQVAQHTIPKPAPAQTVKPLWPRSHSS